jgi:hypothetical protein
MNDYGIAQICLNGHLLTSKSNVGELVQNFCSNCGESIISTCPHCSTPIRGSYREKSHITGIDYRYFNGRYLTPSYCYNCGSAFPWTQRSKEAATELINLSNDLSESEKTDFKESIEDLIHDTPKTSIALIKFKKYAAKAGGEIAKGLKDILIDLVSESVKKAIWQN